MTSPPCPSGPAVDGSVLASGAVIGPAPRHVQDDEWLSQAGTRRADRPWNFRNCLRPQNDERDLSLQLGWLSAWEVHIASYGGGRAKRGNEAVRRFQAGNLRVKGFRVEHTPRYPASPSHVSVFWDHGEWNDNVASMLDACAMEEEA